MLCAFALMAATGMAYYVLCAVENKRRDTQYGKAQETVDAGLEAERNDQTDGQNPNFRYTY